MRDTHCVICGSPAGAPQDNKCFPFCSPRCQLADLGRWLDGDYRIPGEPVDESGEPPDSEGDSDTDSRGYDVSSR